MPFILSFTTGTQSSEISMTVWRQTHFYSLMYIILIWKSWVDFWLVKILPPNTSLTPKIGDLKRPPSNYDQTVSNGATLWNDRRCEVTVVATGPKYSVDSHVCRLKSLFDKSADGGFSPINLGFSCQLAAGVLTVFGVLRRSVGEEFHSLRGK